jgi:hypothetical protein
MFQQALRTANMEVKSLSLPIYRTFTTKSSLRCKARVSQVLEQVQPALPEAYKTVKQSDDGTIRRNQMIWLVKHSLGKDNAAEKEKLSPHAQPWDTSRPQDDDAKSNASWQGPTVWPHLW